MSTEVSEVRAASIIRAMSVKKSVDPVDSLGVDMVMELLDDGGNTYL
jgi:hypothetical protein